MRLRSILVVSLAFVLPSWTWAQQSDASKKSILFLESVAIPKKAKVCAARIEGFGTKFEPAYEQWHKAHQAQLAEGESLLRAEAEKTFTSFEQNVQAVTSLSAQMLGKASQAVLEENCNAMLTKLGAASEPVVAPLPGQSRPDPAH